MGSLARNHPPLSVGRRGAGAAADSRASLLGRSDQGLPAPHVALVPPRKRHTRPLYRRAHAFLTREEVEVPYVVGLAGSVAAGKSTVAQVLQALISRWPGNPRVELVSTDGFLYPNRVLHSRGLM